MMEQHQENNIICVTNRSLCEDISVFFEKIQNIAKAEPYSIILREKDLSEDEYLSLALRVSTLCCSTGTMLFVHNYPMAALKCSADGLHMPLHRLKDYIETCPEEADMVLSRMKYLGASCHSIEDALLAESLGCNYIVSGHIFDTDCKKGLPGRGIDFLKDVVNAVSIPVFAIGGINKENYHKIKEAGASGACLMSSLMISNNPKELLHSSFLSAPSSYT
jgi:thiamine-phosphate pyrophosphorylase